MTRRILREISVFLGLFVLTAIMTWPWILHLRDAVSDKGDPYLHTYFTWWDYHQTFNDPLNLFNATIFYPYKDTLAFSENDYGVAVPFFPLYALGIDPLTVFSFATLVAFAFSGYGMFRLTRTLTDSTGAAWVSAIVFAFVPYHFQRLPHLPLIFAGWIPLMLEAAVLFARQRSWRRALWLGFAFLMNALTCVVWFTLTLVPLAISIVCLWLSERQDVRGWRRGMIALAASFILTCAFLYPYYRVHKEFGFARSAEDAITLSARPINWLAVSERSKFWKGMGGAAATDELSLFPGLLPPLLMIAAFLLVAPSARAATSKLLRGRIARPPRWLLVLMDLSTFAALLITVLTIGYGRIQVHLGSHQILRSTHATRALIFAAVIVAIRLVIAPPETVRRIFRRDFFARFRSDRRALPMTLALIWLVTGFFGSLGMHFPFHRILFALVLPFRSIRAPARWAMICYIGLALLAGFGAIQLCRLVKRWIPRMPQKLVFGAVVLLMLFEQRVAPIQFTHGDRPDALTNRLKITPMSGGLVELPAEPNGYAYHGYVFRAVYHGRPIVTASSSFSPPLVEQIESLTRARPIPDRLMDVLEGIPTSYLVVHNSLLPNDSRPAIDSFLARQSHAGRITFINSYGNPMAPDDLYAITKTEPAAKPEATHRQSFAYSFLRQQYVDVLNREPTAAELETPANSINQCGVRPECVTERRLEVLLELFDSREFRDTGGLAYRAFEIAFRRPPAYVEWQRAREKISAAGNNPRPLVEEWIHQQEFVALYPESLANADYVDKLLQNSPQLAARRDLLIENLSNGTMTRSDVLLELTKDAARPRDNEAFIRLCYLIFLKRDPDSPGYNYWLQIRRTAKDDMVVIQGFLNSGEYRDRFGLAADVLRSP